MATPTTALLMRSDPAECRRTAKRLRRLGLAVESFGDESHLYARAITPTPRAASSVVILAEPTGPVVEDLEVLRSAHRATPMVIVGRGATPEVARRLRAACLPCEHPTVRELRDAIDAAVNA